MSWRAIRLPLLLLLGFSLPALIVMGIKAIPKEWLSERPEPKTPVIKVTRAPVLLATRNPAIGFDPFRPILAAKTEEPEHQEVVVEAQPVRSALLPPQNNTPKPPDPTTETPLPEPKLEGVVGGDDPVAVINLDGDSHFARVGDLLPGGIKIVSITDSEVRLKRGQSELVLKTGIR